MHEACQVALDGKASQRTAATHSARCQEGPTWSLSRKRKWRGTPSPLETKTSKHPRVSTWLQASSGPGQAACLAEIPSERPVPAATSTWQQCSISSPRQSVSRRHQLQQVTTSAYPKRSRSMSSSKSQVSYYRIDIYWETQQGKLQNQQVSKGKRS